MLKRAVFCLIIVLTLVADGAGAVAATIAAIRVEGTVRTNAARVKQVLTCKVGQQFSAAAVDRDVRSIYSLGDFDNIQVDKVDDGGALTLVYRVKELPLVRAIKITGNEELKKSKVRSALTMRTPSVLHPQDIEQSVAAIKKLYVDEGYYAAEITPRVEPRGDNDVYVYFDIVEGTKVTIDNIEFEGNTVFSARELRGMMETSEWWFMSWLTSGGTYNEAMLANDLELIKDAYFNKGYIRVRVKQPLITLSDDREEMNILIEIEEGDQYYLGETHIEGDLLRDESELLQLLRFNKGDVFSRKRLRAAIKHLNDFYADNGYAYVNVSPSTLINNEDKTVDVTFKVEQGVQVHFGHINIGGNTKTRDKVIRREMVIVEGDLYSGSGVETSRKRIKNLGFFSEVNLDTVPTDDEKVMDVNVDVKEQATGTFSVGFGYSSADGIIGQGSVSQDNFLGLGLNLHLAASLGSDSTNFNVGILDPYFMDRHMALGFDAYNNDREWDDYSEKTVGGDVKLGIPINYETRTFFIYRYERNDIYDIYDLASPHVLESEGVSTRSSIYASISTNTTDFRPDPSRGFMSELSLEYAGIGGSEHYVKTIADYRHFLPIKWGIVFSWHGQLGYVGEIGDNDIPIDERFYLGGLRTIRGFESREVGPWEWERTYKLDANGYLIPKPGGGYETEEAHNERDYIGGVKEAFCNFEIIFPLVKSAGLKGVIFFDTGNTWDSGESFMSDLRYSAGAGIRWNSPLGPLRLEWGYNLDPEPWEDNSKFDFTIGKFF